MKTVRLKYVVSLIQDRRPFHSGDRYLGLDNMGPWTGAYRWAEDPNVEGLVGVFEEGDILFGKLRPYLAKVVSPAESGVCSTEALILRAGWQVHRDFLRYVLAVPRFIDRVNAATFGSKMPRASWENIGSERIPLPDLATQRRIADFLDRETGRIDLLIEKKARLVELTREGEIAYVAHGFWQLDARTWRVRHLGKLRHGAGFPIDLQNDPSKDIAFFKVKHLKTHGLDAAIIDADDTISEETARSLRATIFPKGTIVFAKIGAALLLGRVSMLGCAACIDNNMSAFIPNNRLIEPNFALLGLSQADMKTMVQPGAVPSLSTVAFYNFGIPLPAMEVQQNFVDQFRSWRSKNLQIIEKVQDSIDRLMEYRSALITAAVTGQIDVTTWSKEGLTDRCLDRIEEDIPA